MLSLKLLKINQFILLIIMTKTTFDIEDKFIKDLSPIELHFLQETDRHDLNTCNNCNIIKNTWVGLNWDCDHDLRGHTALCDDCYRELNCKPYED